MGNGGGDYYCYGTHGIRESTATCRNRKGMTRGVDLNFCVGYGKVSYSSPFFPSNCNFVEAKHTWTCLETSYEVHPLTCHK